MKGDRRELGRILEKHGVQPVGSGYIDCICPCEKIGPFLAELQEAGFIVTDYSLWQYVRSSEETVWGQGGPRCRYREGWYSELNLLRPWQGRAELEAFLTEEERRLQCVLAPGLWLAVLEDCGPPVRSTFWETAIMRFMTHSTFDLPSFWPFQPFWHGFWRIPGSGRRRTMDERRGRNLISIRRRIDRHAGSASY